MDIIETSVFTRQTLELLPEDEYREFQVFLASHPDAADLIKGGGGLRKIRWAREGQGKRGGVRIIYYWAVPKEQLLLLLMYAKSQHDDLTPVQLKRLRAIIDAEQP